MSRSLPHTILITGATGAIGRALAEQYAAPGTTLILFGRDQKRLELVSGRCSSQGARVLLRLCDLLNHKRFMEQLQELCAEEPPELVIANAGVSSTAGSDGESWEAIEEVVRTNLLAAMATVQSVVPFMRQQGKGHIALVSSLAAWHGLPITPSYSASKAAIKNYGEALQNSLACSGIKVSIILPGFVESEMSRSVPGPKPFLISSSMLIWR